MSKEYSTGEIAKILQVHPNTVRWYDDAGLIPPARRTKSGYRKFDDNHLTQLRVLRVIYGGKYSNKKIRNSAFAVLDALRDVGKSDAIHKAEEYRAFLKKEYASAHKAVAVLHKWMTGSYAYPSGALYNRTEAAKHIGVTVEVLRNWERNGLIFAPRMGKKNEQVYGETEIMRMRLIYMLRQNNYSIAAIHSSLTLYDKGDLKGAALALNSPAEDPERTYLLACDHWLEVLEKLLADADKMFEILCKYTALCKLTAQIASQSPHGACAGTCLYQLPAWAGSRLLPGLWRPGQGIPACRLRTPTGAGPGQLAWPGPLGAGRSLGGLLWLHPGWGGLGIAILARPRRGIRNW